MNDKYSKTDIKVESELLSKLDNFWFYNKWKVIITIFVTFVLTVCIAQSCTRQKEDVAILYSGPGIYVSSEIEKMREELNSLLPYDVDGNGSKYVGIVTYQVMSEESLRELEAEYAENDKTLDTSYFTNQKTLYESYLLTGKCAVLLVDRPLFESLEINDRLRKLSDVFSEVPESAVDEYGIRFSETSLYKNSEIFSTLPEDTILCLLRPYVVGDMSKPKLYSAMTSMFVAMAAE